MARWEPHASERLVVAALDLFEERGYENATVVEIAEHAGLTKSTFFRHFADKREVLFGDDTLSDLLVAGIAAAADGGTALEAVAHAFDGVGEVVFTPGRRTFSARRAAVIAGTSELREREALKELGLIASMVDALKQRGIPDLAAHVAAELGALAFKNAYARWRDPTTADDFTEIVRHAISDVRDASSVC